MKQFLIALSLVLVLIQINRVTATVAPAFKSQHESSEWKKLGKVSAVAAKTFREGDSWYQASYTCYSAQYPDKVAIYKLDVTNIMWVRYAETCLKGEF